MSDPLGLIQSASAGNLSGVSRVAPRPVEGGTPTDPSAPSFKDVLLNNINQVSKLQKEAEVAAEDLATGKRSDLESVVLATQKADTAFRMLVTLRNKMQSAFEEIKQMRV